MRPMHTSLAAQGRWQELLDYYADEDHRPGADALPVEADAAPIVHAKQPKSIYLPHMISHKPNL